MRWSKLRGAVVFFLDLVILVAVSMVLFLLSPEGNGTGGRNLTVLLLQLLILWGGITLFQTLFHTYESLWRYAESKEYLSLMAGMGCGVGLYLLAVSTVLDRRLSGLFLVSITATSLLGMFCLRFLYRTLRAHVAAKGTTNSRPTIILGAGDASAILLQELHSFTENPYRPVLVLDDDAGKWKRRIVNVPIAGPIEELQRFARETGATDLIFAIPSCEGERRTWILNLCAETGCHVHVLPDLVAHLDGRKGHLVDQMREVELEDLLGRKPVIMDSENVLEFLRGKRVMVTGGGGSIGSELCRQVASFVPKSLVILDIYENNAYDIQQELLAKYPKLALSVEIASVRDEEKINRLFARYRPQVVFHAAAHKHVPLMETAPEEAVKNNVFGTWNVVRAADRYRTEKFVLISSDKAVNPTNVMGATKRLCELLLQGMSAHSQTEYAAVRFGNVLGSNGSVIPLFRRQIARGGPVTVTDKRIIRYFMTIPEASSLVLQAAAMAHRSQVFVLDMGKPVLILTLAENLIRLSGHTPYQDIHIEEIGLRPGEKLYEELLIGGGDLGKTENQLIFVDRQTDISLEQLTWMLKCLAHAVEQGDREGLLGCLHQVVPSYRDADEVNQAAADRAVAAACAM